MLFVNILKVIFKLIVYINIYNMLIIKFYDVFWIASYLAMTTKQYEVTFTSQLNRNRFIFVPLYANIIKIIFNSLLKI